MDINKAVCGVLTHWLMLDFEAKTKTIWWSGKTMVFTIKCNSEKWTIYNQTTIKSTWTSPYTVSICGPKCARNFGHIPVPLAFSHFQNSYLEKKIQRIQKNIPKKSPTKYWRLKVLIIPHDVPTYKHKNIQEKTSILIPWVSAVQFHCVNTVATWKSQ